MPPMKPFNSLRRRIVTAYLLFTLGISVFFALAAAIIVEGIELRLVDERLKDVAAWASPRHMGKLPVEMPTGLSFYQGPAIPHSLRTLPAGVQEINVDGIGLHVLSGQNAAGPFVVVDHESDYEQVEVAVYSLLGLGFMGFIGMSLLLGRFMARRFVIPIIALSEAVARRQSELPLQNNNDELGVLARAFTQYASEMQHFLDRERFFTGDVSHELRTPLTIISGAAEILMLESAGKPALFALAERIYRATQEASESVAVLLLLARSPDLIESTEISISELAKEEVARYQYLVSNTAVALVFGGGGDFSIRAPRKLLSAAVGNLILNACQYTAQGMINVRIQHGTLIVEDSGRGLPDAVRTMLGGKNGATFPGSAGSGLGLALVKRICEYLGADLAVSDRASGGTVFQLHFSNALTQS